MLSFLADQAYGSECHNNAKNAQQQDIQWCEELSPHGIGNYFSNDTAKTYAVAALINPMKIEYGLNNSERSTYPNTNEPTAMLPKSANFSANT